LILLTEFFKKPGGSVCGRFLNDQLEREIQIPKKRIPWVKYFFQFTLPAFILSLKSCGERTMGKVDATQTEKTILNSTPITMGEPQMSKTDCKVISVENYATLGLVGPTIVNDTAMSKPEVVEEVIGDVITSGNDTATFDDNIDTGRYVSVANADTSTISENYLIEMMGEVIVTHANTKTDTIKSLTTITRYQKTNLADKEILVYPNPIKAGALLTIVAADPENFPRQIQLISSSGQILTSILQNKNEYSTTFSIRIPENVTAGTYFIQLIYNDNTIKTTKLVVMK